MTNNRPERTRRAVTVTATATVAAAALVAGLAGPGGFQAEALGRGAAVQRVSHPAASGVKKTSKPKRTTTSRPKRKTVPLALPALAAKTGPVITAALFENKDYPYANAKATGGDNLNMGVRQCTSYAAWALTREGLTLTPDPRGGADVVGPKGTAHLADAYTWDENAKAAGFTVNTIPTVGAIAQWDAEEQSSWMLTSDGQPGGSLKAGDYGHVGVVIAINPDGTARIRDYNGWQAVTFSEHSEVAARYIHFVT